MKEYMKNLMNQYGGKDVNVERLFCLSPDNARILIRDVHPSLDGRNDNSSRSSSQRSTRMPIDFISTPFNEAPSRWSNSCPTAMAVQAAILVADSSTDEDRWKGIHSPSRWSNASPSTATRTKKIRKVRGGSVPSRTSPKELLESSMGGLSLSDLSSITVPHTVSSYHDRWTGENTICIPPSPPCRRRSCGDVHQHEGNNYNNNNNVKQRNSTHNTRTSRRGNSGTGPRRSRSSSSVMERPLNNHGATEISSNAAHPQNTLGSSEMYKFEAHWTNNRCQHLPNSLRTRLY
jgi:hypothetical protein